MTSADEKSMNEKLLRVLRDDCEEDEGLTLTPGERAALRERFVEMNARQVEADGQPQGRASAPT